MRFAQWSHQLHISNIINENNLEFGLNQNPLSPLKLVLRRSLKFVKNMWVKNIFVS